MSALNISYLLSRGELAEAKALCEQTDDADIAMLEGIVLFHHSKTTCPPASSRPASSRSDRPSRLTERVRPALTYVFCSAAADQLGLPDLDREDPDINFKDMCRLPKIESKHLHSIFHNKVLPWGIPSWETTLNVLLVCKMPRCLPCAARTDLDKAKFMLIFNPLLKIAFLDAIRLLNRDRDDVKLLQTHCVVSAPFVRLHDCLERDDWKAARECAREFPRHFPKSFGSRLFELGYSAQKLRDIGISVPSLTVAEKGSPETVLQWFNFGKRRREGTDISADARERLGRRSEQFWVELNALKTQPFYYAQLLTKQRSKIEAMVKADPDVSSALVFRYPWLMDLKLSEDNLINGLAHFSGELPCVHWKAPDFDKIAHMPRLLKALADKSKQSHYYKTLLQ